MNAVPVTLRVARDTSARQAALSDWLAVAAEVRCDADRAAAIVEGALTPLDAPAGVVVERVAGCFCCVGQVALGVALTRLLRTRRPTRLLLLLASDAHLDRVRRMLGERRLAMLQLLD